MDYRHGPIAVAGPRSAVWDLDGLPDGLAADVERLGARTVVPYAEPLVALVLAQRVAVALAESEGLDPDRPLALTRSVVLGGGQATRSRACWIRRTTSSGR